jgi:hypothetical protein
MIPMLRKLLNRLIYGGTTHLRPYEQECLSAWERNLTGEAQAILRKQLARFDLIQRNSKDKIVTFYSAADPSFRNWPADALFPIKDDEICIARATLFGNTGGRRTQIKADIVLHRGRLSSLEFTRSPPVSLEVERHQTTIQTFCDPMKAGGATTVPISLQDLTGWVHDWAVEHKAEHLRAPLTPADRNGRVAQIDAVLPDDYLDIVAQTEGMKFAQCVLLGLSEIRRIVRPGESYYVLAEIEDKGEVAVVQGTERKALVYLAQENDDARQMQASLRDTLDILNGEAKPSL